MVSTITPNHLLEFEADVCRSRHRTRWWRGASNDAGAVGRMVGDFLEARNRAAQQTGAGFRPLSQATLRAALLEHEGEQLAGATLSNFLNGEANTGGNRDWYAFAPRVLRLVLAGTAGDQAPPAVLAPVDRACRFFFPEGFRPGDVDGDRARTWFFHPRLRGIDAPATAAEEVAELRAIAYRCGPDAAHAGRALVAHVSGDKPFPHVCHRGTPTDLGRQTLDCLRAGVDVYLCFPRTARGTEAADSAERFAHHAGCAAAGPGRLTLVPLDPATTAVDPEGRDRWAGEYLGRSLRYWHQRCGPTRPTARWAAWASMGVSRDAQWGPCAFQPDDGERESFARWLDLFVLKPRGAAEPAAGRAPSKPTGHGSTR